MVHDQQSTSYNSLLSAHKVLAHVKVWKPAITLSVSTSAHPDKASGY